MKGLCVIVTAFLWSIMPLVGNPYLAVIARKNAGGAGGSYDESFEGTGYEGPYSGWGTATGTVDPDATAQAYDGSQSFGVSQVLTGTESYNILDLGDDTDDVDITFWVYTDTLTLPSSPDYFVFFAVHNQAGAWGSSAQMYYATSVMYYRGVGAGTSTATALTEDVWQEITVNYRRNATSTLSVNGGASVTWTANNVACGRLYFGPSFGLDTDESWTGYIDAITVDKSP